MRRESHVHTDVDATRLYAVARALTGALTPADVATAVFSHALVELGAATAGFWLVDGDHIRFAGGAGHEGDAPERIGPIPLDSDLPAAICVRTGEVVAYGSRAERDRRWPSLAVIEDGAETVVALPLAARGDRLGCLHIGYAGPTPVEQLDLAFLERLAELCAAALDRAELYEAEREQRAQLEFFSDATRLLSSSLEPAEVMQALVDIAVPRLAEWCVLLVPEDTYLRPVAARFAAAPAADAATFADESLAIDGDTLAARAFRTAEIQCLDAIGETNVREIGADAAALVRRAAGALSVPIVRDDRTIGVLGFGLAPGTDPRDAKLRAMAEGLALRAGVPLHNAGLYDQERRIARTLRDAVVPALAPTIPGYDCALRYLPAAGTVAGDWYDVLDLGDRHLVGVGDAAGHGLPAATLMAELRNSARGLAAAGHSPAEILDALSVLADRLEDEVFATAVYGLLDTDRHVLEWANAGHPPPLLLRNGRVTQLRVDQQGVADAPPLAPGLRTVRRTARIDLELGDVVVLFTDGVVEHRDSDVSAGLEALARVLAPAGDAKADAIVDQIVLSQCEGALDDCLVVALRRTS